MGIPLKAAMLSVATDEIDLKDASVCECFDLTTRLTILQRVRGVAAPSPNASDEKE